VSCGLLSSLQACGDKAKGVRCTVKGNLDKTRIAIDKIDSELLRLLNKRMELSREVGRIKQAQGLPLFHPEREEIIFGRLAGLNAGPLTKESLRSIYREIFAASRLLQYVPQIAFLGPEWTYSHVAALSLFGHSARYTPCNSLEDVFDHLMKGDAHFAVVPIENSLHGGVGHSMDLMYEREVRVVSECYLEITHHLCSMAEMAANVKRLYAHPQAAEQCRRWILDNLPGAEYHESTSTTQSAVKAQGDPEGAAICNLYAADHYGLKILADHIEDHAGNTTRFLALGGYENSPTGNDKTSMLFAVSDRPGALHSALDPLSRSDINMTRIESRPNRLLPWQYLFYVDIEGHREEEPLRKTLEELKSRVTYLKILGSYPKGDPTKPFRIEKEKMRQARKVKAP
jgi:chorismate mutase / prephenate dehydratase